MSINRKEFLKLAGLSAAVISSGINPVASAPKKKKEAKVNKPLSASKWAMVVDIKKCSNAEGCTKCMDSCHSVHNVPKIDSEKSEVKWIWKEKFYHAFPNQNHKVIEDGLLKLPVVVLCNHCDNAPCIRVCPTQATFKRDDGIVMMDMHRCIGCRYCIAACPYGSRSFNWMDPLPFIENPNMDYPTRTKGVVEKCNFCAERLALGKGPACMEICPEGALFFGDIEDPESDVRKILSQKYSIRRKPSLGTEPEVYYIV